MRVHNFSAGPGALPESVVQALQEQLWELGDTGLGLVESSHRSAAYMAIVEEARQRLHRLLGCDDDQVVLFLHGGARTQFFQIPMTFLRGGTAAFFDTGVWSKGAMVEAARFGKVQAAFSAREAGYTSVPKDGAWQPFASDAKYLHYTSNNTVAGCQFDYIPSTDVPLVCDMSSDILSRPIDGTRFSLIYAGAQKNLGVSGTTVVVVRKSWLDACGDEDLPTMLRYGVHIGANTLYNTPCTFAVYTLHLMLQWIEAQGGLDAIHQRNVAQATRVYQTLESSQVWRPKIGPDSRSLMNITFTSDDPAVDERFWRSAAKEGLVGLKGHRTLGGLRATMYNAQTDDAVDALIAFLTHFEEQIR